MTRFDLYIDAIHANHQYRWVTSLAEWQERNRLFISSLCIDRWSGYTFNKKFSIAYMLTPYLRVTINGMVSYLAGKSRVDFSNIDYVTPLIIGGVAIRLMLIKIS